MGYTSCIRHTPLATSIMYNIKKTNEKTVFSPFNFFALTSYIFVLNMFCTFCYLPKSTIQISCWLLFLTRYLRIICIILILSRWLLFYSRPLNNHCTDSPDMVVIQTKIFTFLREKGVFV